MWGGDKIHLLTDISTRLIRVWQIKRFYSIKDEVNEESGNNYALPWNKVAFFLRYSGFPAAQWFPSEARGPCISVFTERSEVNIMCSR